MGAAFDRATPVDLVLHDWLGGSGAALTAGRFVAAVTLLLVPTSLMGLTMPLASSTAIVRASFGQRLGLVYGVNTAGGVLGACATGFYGVGALGADATLPNRRHHQRAGRPRRRGAVAARACQRCRGGARQRADVRRRPRVAVPAGAVRPGVLTVVVAATGAASLALEVLWFRALVQQTAATTYAFTTMLAVVLTGIALGSLAAGWLLRRPRNWVDWLAGSEPRHRRGRDRIARAARLGGTCRRRGPASPARSARWPCCPRWCASGPACRSRSRSRQARAERRPASHGGSAGSTPPTLPAPSPDPLLGGFVLLPLLGVRDAIVAAGAVFACAAVLLRASAGRFAIGRDVPIIAVLIGVAVAGPDPLDMAFARRHGGGQPAGWRHDGVQATVMVHAARQRRVLYIDGLHQAADQPGMVKVHRTIGHLAMALHRNPRHALVIGLGGGATAGAVASHRPATLDIVELNEGVRLAAPLFAHISYDVLNRPRTVLHIDDARSFLLTTRARYDVVTADIIQPTHAGAGALYSREYFQRVRDRLRPGGVVVQWVGQREDSAYKLIARTFLDVFPETTAWVGGTLLVGSNAPLTISRAAFERQLADPATREALAAVDLTSVDALTSWYSAGPDTLRAFVGPGPLLTDDRPTVEYFRTLPRGEPAARLDRLRDDVRTTVVP